jgi:hypothetical protein
MLVLSHDPNFKTLGFINTLLYNGHVKTSKVVEDEYNKSLMPLPLEVWKSMIFG